MTKPTARNDMNEPERNFQKLEENLKKSFRISADEPSPVDITRLKARAESIPSAASKGYVWLRPLLIGTCAIFAVMSFQNTFQGTSGSKEIPARSEHSEIKTGESVLRNGEETNTTSAFDPGFYEETWDEEALHFLEIGWEADYELDLLHGVPNAEETALLLAAYESL